MRHTLVLVSYFNTKPFIEGLNHSFSEDELRKKLLPPAECSLELSSGKCNMALIPVGALLDFRGITILKDHCIGADGAVDSVYLFSQVPVYEIEQVLLDRHSRTSNGLTRILMERHWKHKVSYQKPCSRDFNLIKGKTAGVAIGDTAYRIKNQFPFVFDLSEAWKAYTQLPFVFAVWAYRKEQWSEEDVKRIDQALTWGRQHRKLAALKWGENFGYSTEEAERYLCRSIKYKLDSPKHAALERYIRELKELS